MSSKTPSLPYYMLAKMQTYATVHVSKKQKGKKLRRNIINNIFQKAVECMIKKN